MSHELRTPLSSLTMIAEKLSSEIKSMDTAEAEDWLRRLRFNAAKMQAMLENIRIWHSLAAGDLRPAIERVSFHECIEDAIALVQPYLDRKDQRVDVAEAARQVVVLGDRWLIEHVLLNLLINASKYGPQKSVITVLVSFEGDLVRVRVTDQGPGIPSEEQGRIFERYVRGTTASGLDADGLGLGLALVKSIIQLHGGKVGVDSDVGKGSSFWFTLQRADPEQVPGAGEGRIEDAYTVAARELSECVPAAIAVLRGALAARSEYVRIQAAQAILGLVLTFRGSASSRTQRQEAEQKTS